MLGWNGRGKGLPRYRGWMRLGRDPTLSGEPVCRFGVWLPLHDSVSPG